MWEQLQEHFSTEHEFGMVPLQSKLCEDLQALARGEKLQAIEASEADKTS